MDLGLRGLRAIVSGGTKGIGRAIVETLAAEGANVAFCARDAAEVKTTVAALRQQSGSSEGRALDVGDAAALKDWVVDVADTWGGLDIVIANVSALAGGSEEAWYRCFEIDIMHSVRMVEAAQPYLERSSAAAITTISSVSGREIDFGAGSYGAMKAALIHYTQGLAFNLASKNIRANTVSPGNTYFPGGVWSQIERDDPQLFANSLALNPTGRMARPQEIARAVAFISSPAASFITGTNLVVDGALTRGVQF